MGRLLKNKTAQNTLEYALVLGIVVAVFSTMQLYFKRGMQAKVKHGIDNVSDQALNTIPSAEKAKVTDLLGSSNIVNQYEPYYMADGSSDMTTTSSEGTEKGTINESGGVREVTNATSSREGSQMITGVSE